VKGSDTRPTCVVRRRLARGFAFAVLAALLAPALAQAAPGDLDRSFGNDGWLRTRIVAHDQARAVVIDSNRRIVAAGRAADGGRFGVARYRPSGRLDHSFSGDGKVTARFEGGPSYVTNSAGSVAIEPRGRIVAVGSKCNWSAAPAEGGELLGCEFALARYKPNGSPDPSFDGDGKLTTDFGNVYALSVAIDSQDRVIAAGGDIVARYRQNGTLDPSFGNGGVAIKNFTGTVNAVAIDSEGRIVAVGDHYKGNIDHFLVARFLPNGSPDPSFGSGHGRVTIRRGFATAVAIDSKDRILAAGSSRQLGTSAAGRSFTLALYKPDGTPAQWFGNDGRVTTHWRDRHSALVGSVGIDSHGRPVAIGSHGHEYALARYHPNGDLDRSFSGNGKASGRFVFPNRRHAGFVHAGVLDPQDRVVVAGGDSHFLLARFIGHGRH
jgi:uncharacterized delta-60 repeat protein